VSDARRYAEFLDELVSMARTNTAQLHEDPSPRWKRIRVALRDEGVAPNDAAIGILFPDGSVEFGIIATRDGRVFSFELQDGEMGDLDRRFQEGSLYSWDELLDESQRAAYAGPIQAARRLLQDEIG
jgi:hypothetical protein